MPGTPNTNNDAVDAYHCMEEKEQYEVLVVVKADTVIDPDAMVVKLFTAGVAQGTVLRASWLRDFTCVTPSFFVEYQLVIAVSFYSAFQVSLGHRFVQASWVSEAGLIIAPVACEHAWHGDILMAHTDVWVG